ncbi:OmpA family protein [Vibrio sp. SCSIO 43136]|uniref:OmpA family protein n=1 Tax=Vibrio sp. SCSIO 43136 TaxID=2819101 RepID=UPI002074FAC2|nr:OmpA family protein [Vibrio sp. SCSIO 43136]USD67802.1 OmpA family protein [Vibrio sp. SCSIO 43136]
MARLVTLILCILVVGCTSYPPQGRGGLAEQYPEASFSPVMPDEPLGPEHGLRFDWQLGKLHLDALIQEGARWCFPAAVVQATERQNRIARELEGGLLIDAANDLIIFRKSLNELEKKLDYVTSQTRCVPPSDTSQLLAQLDLVNQLFNLLNVDNQFAHDSAEINPKYMGHLAQAAGILRDHHQLTLKVTGHADATGTAEHNQKLAKARAKQVERYLTIFGVSPNQIETHAVGSELPLFDGDSPAVLLTNRRVSVEVINNEQ